MLLGRDRSRAIDGRYWMWQSRDCRQSRRQSCWSISNGAGLFDARLFCVLWICNRGRRTAQSWWRQAAQAQESPADMATSLRTFFSQLTSHSTESIVHENTHSDIESHTIRRRIRLRSFYVFGPCPFKTLDSMEWEVSSKLRKKSSHCSKWKSKPNPSLRQIQDCVTWFHCSSL